jgi:hypothetical protein
MKANDRLCTWLCLVLACLMPTTIWGGEPEKVPVGDFSTMTPGGGIADWESMTFKKIEAHTHYALVSDHGRTVLKADSRASASGLVRKVSLRPGDYPWITWSWKVSNILEKGDVREKSGDDYAARIYITFAEDPATLSFFKRTKMAAIKLLYGETPPSAALAYVWGNRAAVGSIHPNPYTDRVQMIVIESGPAHVNQWRSARRNMVEDFHTAFGTAPPPLSAIAVMTDTDNTGEAAMAWYGDIILASPH